MCEWRFQFEQERRVEKFSIVTGNWARAGNLKRKRSLGLQEENHFHEYHFVTAKICKKNLFKKKFSVHVTS